MMKVTTANTTGQCNIKGACDPSEVFSSNTSESESSYDLMRLPKALAASIPAIYEEKLTPLDLSFGTVRECNKEATVKKVALDPIKRNKDKASVCFLIKRPGCVLCREQGHALSEIAAEFDDVAFWGVIKEIGVDNEGILSLYNDYYKFPFYMDKGWKMYKAMGNRLVGIVPNPLAIWRRYNEIQQRLKLKKIEGRIIGKGEGRILGGIIIFDKKGEIRYAHEELFSRELPADEIRQALRTILDE